MIRIVESFASGVGYYSLVSPLEENDIIVTITCGFFGQRELTLVGYGVSDMECSASSKDALLDWGGIGAIRAYQVTLAEAGDQTIQITQPTPGTPCVLFGFIIKGGDIALSGTDSMTFSYTPIVDPDVCMFAPYGTPYMSVATAAAAGLAFGVITTAMGTMEALCGPSVPYPMGDVAPMYYTSRCLAGPAGWNTTVAATFQTGIKGSSADSCMLYVGQAAEETGGGGDDDEGGDDDAYPSFDVTIDGNSITNSTEAPIAIGYTRDAQVSSNNISESTAPLTVTACRTTNVNSNVISNVTTAAISVSLSSTCLVDGNLLRFCATDPEATSVVLLDSARNCYVHGNRFLADPANTTENAVHVSTGSRKTGIQGNDFRFGYNAVAIRDDGATTVVGDNLPYTPVPGIGDMTKAVYDPDDDGYVENAEYSVISGNAITLDGHDPTYFAESDHEHDAEYSPIAHTHAYAPVVHTHVEADITDLDHDAVKLQGYAIAVTAPAADDVLVWSGAAWTPTALPTPEVDLNDLHEHLYNEDYTAQCNGVKVEFIMVNEFTPESPQVWLNGLLQRPTIDYTEGAYFDTIVFTTAPVTGDVLLISYEVA